MVTRERSFVLKVNDEERQKLQALAEKRDMSASAVVRSLIRRAYDELVYDEPAKGKTK